MTLFRRTEKETTTDNPYLNARRTWNNMFTGLFTKIQFMAVALILALLIALAAVGGIIHIGSLSKFVPYVVETDKLGQSVSVGPASVAGRADPRVVRASVAAFINDARVVTPDVALQRAAVFRIYAMLSSADPAAAKMNEWLNGNEEASPFKRAAKVTVAIQIESVIPQSAETWQVDWTETVRDRQGVIIGKPFPMKALINVYEIAATETTTEEQLIKNPLGLFIRDFSWSKQI